MILNKITYTNFSLPFIKRFLTSNASYKCRSGFILKIEDELGNIVYGEASPLEGFGTDSLNDAEKSLNFISNNLVHTILDDNFTSISNFSLKNNLASTTHFAFDQCLLNLFLIRNHKKLKKIFPERKLFVNVNSVIGFMPLEEILSKIESEKNNGFETFKIKVGRDSIENDIKIVSSIRNTFGKTIKIRLDANAKWKLNKAVENVQKLEKFDIQYIEQPVKEIDEIIRIAENTSVSIAPDECIKTNDDVYRFFGNDRIKYLVLKPSLLGSIFNTLNLINAASERNKIIIISSALESAVGRSAVSFIASFCKNNLSHGLATGEFFNSDLSEDYYSVKNGIIDISKYPPEFENVSC